MLERPLDGSVDAWLAYLEHEAVATWGQSRAGAIQPALRRMAEAIQRVMVQVPSPETAPFSSASPAGTNLRSRPSGGSVPAGTASVVQERLADTWTGPADGAASEPFELTATAAAAAIRAGRLSPVTLLESLLQRIAALDSAVHAWVRLDEAGARAAAAARAEEAVRGALRGPLHGVPIGLKDIYATAGLATEAGSPLRAGFIPDEDAVLVARLRAAGAIVLGKTETTQFASADPAPTRNPWNLEHTPGGSSSGSAAAVAARMVPAALGTQTAGSILRPAAFCGVVGFKPSAGRFSLDGIFPLAWTLDHPGTLTRSVADARLLFSVLDDLGGVEAGRVAAPRLGLLRGAFLQRASADALNHLDHTAARFAAAGADVRDVELPPGFDLAVDVQHLIMHAEAAAFHQHDHARSPDAYRPNLRATIETGALIPATIYLRAQRLRVELSARVQPLLQGVDGLLMPSAPGVAPAGLGTTGDPVFNAPWSLLGMPALSLPSGLSADGLPYGLQIVGARLDDARVLDVAGWCESVLGSLPPPRGLPR